MATELLDGIQLAATDLDGTLLLNFTQTVSEEAFPVIERFCDTGAYFFAASGRQYASLRWLFEPVADRIGYVCENGGLVILNDEVIVRQSMDHSLMLEICKMADSIPDCKYAASGSKTAYAPAREKEFIRHLVEDVGDDITPVERPEDIKEDIIKVAFQVPAERNEEVRQQFEECFGADCNVVTSGNEWIDVLEYGINKGSALSALSHAINVPVSAMAAFGDAENDREMLELVGHPYLMDPCFETMTDIAELPKTKRCSKVETELQRIMGEIS